ncbi:MAG: hypothetical protein AAF664_05410 [Planctomycetota bacterium]
MHESVITVEAGSRIHFGLLSTRPPFGGAGVMVDRPVTKLSVTRSQVDSDHVGFIDALEHSAELVARVESLVRTFREHFQIRDTFYRLSIESLPASHCGFGSGTQLSLAVLDALCQLHALPCQLPDLAVRLAGRGKRSAVGVHGYRRGGLIIEEPNENRVLNDIKDHLDVPTGWRVMLLTPFESVDSVSGSVEKKHFEELATAEGLERSRSDMEEMLYDRLPNSVHSEDFDAFAKVVGQYNELSGRMFASMQGGSHRRGWVGDTITHLREGGYLGVGQSSWGPGVFAWVPSEAVAFQLKSMMTDVGHVEVAKPIRRRLPAC